MKKKIEEINPVQQHPLLKLAEISILLTSYNDIFSAFDPSAYAERTLSDDFITQAKKISQNKSGNKMLLRLLLPAHKRNDPEDEMIVKRLHSYFKSVHQQLASGIRKTNKIGFLLTLIGIILMTAASYLSFMKPEKFAMHLLLVLFEPAGWFMLWVGLDHLVYALKDTKKELSFYSKMVKSEIIFYSHQTESSNSLSGNSIPQSLCS